ncbi:MAG: GMC family oxidoreductase N-terminal domain-containing protein [Saprospiraceae bacterium]
MTNTTNSPYTAQERRLRTLLRILSCLFGLAVFGYLLPALVGPFQSFYVNLPFVSNSVVKIGTLALLAFFASGDIRRHGLLITLLVCGHLISVFAVFAIFLWGITGYRVMVGTNDTSIDQILWGSVVFDGLIVVLLLWFSKSAEKSRLGLKYFSPLQFRVLTALADVVIYGEKEILSPEETARNVDRYLAGFKAKGKWAAKAALLGIQYYPFLFLKVPFSHMNAPDRLTFIKRRFYQNITDRSVTRFWAEIVQGMIRMGKQLCYMGYYNDPKTYPTVGYVPFSQRAQLPAPHTPKPLSVLLPADIRTETMTVDVVVIGTGAAGALLAKGLADGGRQVLLLERGDYVPPGQFSEDEIEMLSKLYSDGAFQLSRDFRLQVLQGSCVGGTTVVNNGVCFDMPQNVLDRWNDSQTLDARLDANRLSQAFADVRKLMQVTTQNHQNLNLGASFFVKGLKNLGYDQAPNTTGPVEANIKGCLGCGYCNIGCKFGKKLSMLDTVLPDAQQAHGSDAFRIIAQCEVMKICSKGKRAESVRCRLGDGRLLEVKANTVVVAAGAISSSVLLQKSGIAGGKAGRNLGFNLVSPFSAVFEKPVNAYNGLQISHYLAFSPDRGYVLETWYNPPLAQSAVMPGWFEEHFNNMLRYNHIATVGALVGSESNAVVKPSMLTGRSITYRPTPGDLKKVVDGLLVAGEILLEGGATTLLPHTFAYHEFRNKIDLARLPQLVRSNADITLASGHPQGGNPVSADARRGVVDPEFKVHGYDNLYVCDASVFPSSLGVNPQLTVMALAHYAAPLIK